MKKLFTIIAMLYFSQVVLGQVEWAPIGAKWWVSIQTDFPFTGFIDNYECTGILDTLGHHCKVVHYTSFDGVQQDLLFYQSGESVYAYDEYYQEFVMLYDYSKQAGESYDIIFGQDTSTFLVDSVTYGFFSGESVKVQHGRFTNPNAPFSEPYNRIYEGIGTYNGLWPSLPSELTVEIWYYLACYQKPDGTILSMNPVLNVDCQALSTPVSVAYLEDKGLHISPNPSTDEVLLEFQLPSGKGGRVLVMDELGRFVKEINLEMNIQSLHLNHLEAGFYFVILQSEEKVVAIQKLIRI